MARSAIRKSAIKTQPVPVDAVTAITASRPAIEIPFNQLFRSTLNVRRTSPEAEIEGLAENIKAIGQIQSLAVVREDDRYGVVAGGRRFLALSLLVERGDLPPTAPVVCVVVSPDEAAEISLAENVMRVAMHPADQFEAFAARADAGQTVEQIAQRFGVSASIVTQRMKLGRVSPAVMDAYRAEDLTLGQVMAFTVSDSHADQDSVLAWLQDQPYRVEADMIRSRLLPEQVKASASIAVFVGLDAYEAAGGTVMRDLFTDNSYLTNPGLLHSLAEKKLDQIEAELSAEGWAWVERFEQPPQWFWSATRVYPDTVDPTGEDAERLEQIVAQIEAYAEIAEERDLTEQEETALETLEMDRERLESEYEAFSEAQKARAGAVLFAGNQRCGEVHRGIIAPAAQKKASKASNADAADEDGGTEDAAAPSFPIGLKEQLLQERTLALQAALASDRVMVLRAAIYSLMSSSYGGPVGLSLTTASVPQKIVKESRARNTVQAFRTEILNPLRVPDSDDLWPWLLKREESELVALLAANVIVGVSAGNADWSTTTDRAGQIAQSIGFDMRDWWTPAAGNLFGSLPKALIADFMRDAGADPEGWEKSKRADLAEKAATHVQGTGWLPPFLRTPINVTA